MFSWRAPGIRSMVAGLKAVGKMPRKPGNSSAPQSTKDSVPCVPRYCSDGRQEYNGATSAGLCQLHCCTKTIFCILSVSDHKSSRRPISPPRNQPGMARHASILGISSRRKLCFMRHEIPTLVQIADTLACRCEFPTFIPAVGVRVSVHRFCYGKGRLRSRLFGARQHFFTIGGS